MRGAQRWCCQGFQAAWPATNRKVLGKNWKLSFRFTAAGQWERGRKSERVGLHQEKVREGQGSRAKNIGKRVKK